MIVNILLIIDFGMLAAVIAAYVYTSLRERTFLAEEADKSRQLQQKIYQAQVLHEITERIGYSLDTSKVVDIITSSLGNLLSYDTVSYLVLTGARPHFRCHVERSVSRQFVAEIQNRTAQACSVLSGDPKPLHLEEEVTGTMLDDRLPPSVGSYFNLPVVISGKLVGVINVASQQVGQYGDGAAGILYTITNQATAAVTRLQELLESERGKLSAAIFSLSDGFIALTPEREMLVYNPAAVEIFGMTAGKPLTSFDVVDRLAGKMDLRTKIDQAISEDRAISLSNVSVGDRVLLVTVAPVKDSSGSVIAASVVFHDQTSEYRLERQRQEFTAIMVHELRAPLTAIHWSADALVKVVGAPAPDPAVHATIGQQLTSISHSAQSMLELVGDLLDVAKIEAGKFELNIQEYDLSSVVKEAAEPFRASAESRHLTFSVDASARIACRFDRVRITQVLSNLLSNAIKFTDVGQVTVRVMRDAEARRAVVEVEDNGIGLSPDELALLFSKYKQLRTEDKARRGTGLGLAVSKGIIDSHRGEISARSMGENMGSTFSFWLPLEGEEISDK